MKAILLRVPEEQAERFGNLCQQKGISKNAGGIIALDDWIEKEELRIKNQLHR